MRRGSQILFGSRLGYGIIPMVSFGLDFAKGMGDGETNTGNVEYDTDTTELGAYAKVTAPLLIQAYVGYLFSATNDIEYANTAFADQEYSGNGYKVGIGWTGLPFLVVNFEYKSITYDEFEDSSGTTEIDTDYETYGVNLSFPLSL